MAKSIRQATVLDVLAVLDRISDITAAEMAEIGLDRWNCLKMAREMLGLGGAEIVSDNGEPLFVIGIYPHPNDDTVFMTWFLATSLFFQHGVSSTLYGRQFMRRLAARHPGAAFESVTWSTHPYVRRWFTLLGFRPVEGTLGTFRYG